MDETSQSQPETPLPMASDYQVAGGGAEGEADDRRVLRALSRQLDATRFLLSRPARGRS